LVSLAKGPKKVEDVCDSRQILPNRKVFMKLRAPWFLASLILTLALLPTLPAFSAPERQQENSAQEKIDLGAKFTQQLRLVFGRFRHADLQSVFENAQPIQCSDLVSDNGEWREVGFFNENRGLGGWFKTSIKEIKSKLDVYTFSGTCSRQQSPISVATRFPVDPSLSAYRLGEIAFGDIQVKTNAPVVASFEKETQAYTFDLPYLFRVSDPDGAPLYALSPRSLSDRYAPDVMNRWECKSVVAEDLTYRFLICRTSLFSRNAPRSGRNARMPYGLSAFSILSDGQEASSSVSLTYGSASDLKKDSQ
jgi:hypothetical protein